MQRSRLSFALIGVFLLTWSVGVFADSYQDLQTGANQFGSILEKTIQEHAAEQADVVTEGKEEFFPMEANASSSSEKRGGGLEASGFVTFRFNGVPYALTDVPVNAWFAPYIRDVANRGIVSGYRNTDGIPTGIFGPERSVSIEELSKMAVEAAHVDQGSCPKEPKNSAATLRWSAPYISCAEKYSFAVYADATVDVSRPATRAEVVMTLLQAFGVALRTPPAHFPLTDVTASTLFSPAITTALQDGIVSGYTHPDGSLTGNFGPENPVNRAEVSKIVSLAVQVYGETR